MLSPPITVPIAFVHGMLQGLRSRGEGCGAYLEEAGIANGLLQHSGARVTAGQYAALFRLLIERRNDEMLGLLSRPMKRGSLALLGRSALSAPTLEVALRRFAHNFGLLQDDLALVPVRDRGLAGMAMRFADPAAAQPLFLHELLLRVVWRLLAWFAGGHLEAARFDFGFTCPPYAASYAKVFPAPLIFDAGESAFWFDAARLTDPVRRDEAALRVFLADAQANIIVPSRSDHTISARLRMLLQTRSDWPGLENAAAALNMSNSTLQKHLANEGTSFQSLKDTLRRDIAVVRLNTSSVSLAALADELGFADSAAFQRAFKSWTGSAPGNYRRGGL